MAEEKRRTLKEILSEAQIIHECACENIIKFEGFWLRKSSTSQKPTTLVICLEWAAGGSLYDYFKSLIIEKDNKTITQYKLPGAILKKWSSNVARGLQFLHHKHYIHNDIKSHNVLICVDPEVPEYHELTKKLFYGEMEVKELKQANMLLKLADFGAVKKADEFGNAKPCHKVGDNDFGMTIDIGPQHNKIVGTSAWMAPELFGGMVEGEHKVNCSQKSDNWSLGVLLWEILTGRVPYKGIEFLAICSKVTADGSTLPIPPTTPKNLRTVLSEKCWEKKPEDRATIDEIVKLIEDSQPNDCSQEYDTINFTDYQETIQNALELLKKESETIDAQKQKVEFEKKLIKVKESQLIEEKKKCAHFAQQTEMKYRATELKEDVINRLTNLSHAEYSTISTLSNKVKKKLSRKIRKGMKHDTFFISRPTNVQKSEGPFDFTIIHNNSFDHVHHSGRYSQNRHLDTGSEPISKSSSNSQYGHQMSHPLVWGLDICLWIILETVCVWSSRLEIFNS